MSRPRTDFIVVHCSASPASQDIGAREIDRWHRSRGFLRIGYHAVIRRSGLVEAAPLTRAYDEPGAHVQGYNSRSVGVCLVGGVMADNATPEDNFTPEQKASLRTTLDMLLLRYPAATVVGHRDIPGVAKACPSFDVKAWWVACNKENGPS